jgi:tight adherence protein B
MNPTFLTASTFMTGVLLAVGGYTLIFDMVIRPRMRIRSRLDREFREDLRERAKRSPLFKNLQQAAADQALREPGFRKRFEDAVEQSGLDVSARRVLSIAIAAAAAFGVSAALFTHNALITSGGAIVGLATPILYVQVVRKRRVRRICGQLPEAFDVISRAVQAGQTVPRAFQVVADECEPPLANEFAYCYEQQNLGLPTDVALRELARRTGVIELQMFVVALIVQRQAGGNPVEMLTNLATVIRKRIRMGGKLRALTAEGRMQAVVLIVLPIVMFASVYVLNRDYAQVLLDRPRLLWAMAGSMLIGAIWINRISQMDA